MSDHDTMRKAVVHHLVRLGAFSDLGPEERSLLHARIEEHDVRSRLVALRRARQRAILGGALSLLGTVLFIGYGLGLYDLPGFWQFFFACAPVFMATKLIRLMWLWQQELLFRLLIPGEREREPEAHPLAKALIWRFI